MLPSSPAFPYHIPSNRAWAGKLHEASPPISSQNSEVSMHCTEYCRPSTTYSFSYRAALEWTARWGPSRTVFTIDYCIIPGRSRCHKSRTERCYSRSSRKSTPGGVSFGCTQPSKFTRVWKTIPPQFCSKENRHEPLWTTPNPGRPLWLWLRAWRRRCRSWCPGRIWSKACGISRRSWSS